MATDATLQQHGFNRIVLIGYRATGKSTISARLAEILDWKLVSTDRLCEESAGVSIPEYVDAYGWNQFRNLEEQVILSLANIEKVIIDTGGGIVERERNLHFLAQNSLVVWLQANIETMISRAASQHGRPRLEHTDLRQDVSETYTQRSALYKRFSNMTISTDENTIDEVTHIIRQSAKL